jgi:hypothetical protein
MSEGEKAARAEVELLKGRMEDMMGFMAAMVEAGRSEVIYPILSHDMAALIDGDRWCEPRSSGFAVHVGRKGVRGES